VIGPKIQVGEVEQAVHAWTKVGVKGKGQGFAGQSPGLRNSIGWLSSLDSACLRVFENGIDASEAYPGWESLVAVGAITSGDTRVIYRKTAKVGYDASNRPQPMVHMLVGRAEEFDLAAISALDSHWLTEESYSPDRIPRLETLSLSSFEPLVAGHDCEDDDADVRGILEELLSPAHTVRRELEADPAAPTRFINKLLAAVPTGLWGSIELAWTVGQNGPVATAKATTYSAAPAVDGRAGRAGLASCALHAQIDELLSGLGDGRRSWLGFSEAFRRGTSGGGAHRQSLPSMTGKGGSSAMSARADWLNHREPIGDLEAQRTMIAIADQPTPEGGWTGDLSGDDLRALLGQLEVGSIPQALIFLDEKRAPTKGLAVAWRETGLAPLGIALIVRRPEHGTKWKTWELPKHLPLGEARKLAGHLSKTDHGLDDLVWMLREGILEDDHMRRTMVAALEGVDPRPEFLFKTVLLRSGIIRPSQLLQVIDDDVDRLATWLDLDDRYRDALRLGLRRPRSGLDWVLHHLRPGAEMQLAEGDSQREVGAR
jgi:hypothetical protein